MSCQALFKMVHAVSILYTLRMLADATSGCNGIGFLVYERTIDHTLRGFSDDKYNGQGASVETLSECEQLCQSDRTASNLIRTCNSFDFRSNSLEGLGYGLSADSTCSFISQPDAYASLAKDVGGSHFSEACLYSSKIRTECKSRLYIFNRIPGRKIDWDKSGFEYFVSNRTECEDKCLNEFKIICRSVNFNPQMGTCVLIDVNWRFEGDVHLIEDDSFEYLENSCLESQERCRGEISFVKMKNSEVDGAFLNDIINTDSLEDCQEYCLRNERFPCQLIMFNKTVGHCVLSDLWYIRDDGTETTKHSVRYDAYYIICIKEGSLINSANAETHERKIFTPFQRYRQQKLDSFNAENIFENISLTNCLHQCVKEMNTCLSASYDYSHKNCLLTKSQDKIRGILLYDPNFDFFKNLMNTKDEAESSYEDRISTRKILALSAISVTTSIAPKVTSGIHESRHQIFPLEYETSERDDVPKRFRAGSEGRFHSSEQDAESLDDRYRNSFSYESNGAIPEKNNQARFGGSKGLVDYFTRGTNHLDALGGIHSTCVEENIFDKIGPGMRLRSPFLVRFLHASSPSHCEKLCVESKEFTCRGFNYRLTSLLGDNCELTDQKNFEMSDPNYFETNREYDYYEQRGGTDCSDVSQICNEDGMEFTIRTSAPFRGRIYSYGYYDRCYTKGDGSYSTVLKISGPQMHPDCGTQRHADVMTNIVVVQFSEFVQTMLDKRYNLTCFFFGPGESVVTSGYIGAGAGSPIPIEYLPAENRLDSKVRMVIFYQNRPTTTIAVGDPLTFRLEPMKALTQSSDIFATNVIARDPYSGRSVRLIDQKGCPVDPYVFPALGRARDGDGLEARFNAFKIPEANFLVFEAIVKACRVSCEPVYCNGLSGREALSLGKKKRSADSDHEMRQVTNNYHSYDSRYFSPPNAIIQPATEQIREMFRVYLSRDELENERNPSQSKLSSCSLSQYYTMTFVISFLLMLLAVTAIVSSIIVVRRRKYSSKGLEDEIISANLFRRNVSKIFPILQPVKLAEMPQSSDLNQKSKQTVDKVQKKFDIYCNPHYPLERQRSIPSISAACPKIEITASNCHPVR